MDNSTDNRIRCAGCKNLFPREGLQAALPVHVTCVGESQTLLFCLDCRRTEFEFSEEPLPPGVDEYTDPINGALILPRINMFEAKEEYCVEITSLQPCRGIAALPIQTSLTTDLRIMYEERDVITVARWIYGGDVGIANAREMYAIQGEHVQLPPVGAVRERRNRIREAFLAKGYFADPELAFVRHYVETGQGDLQEMVATYAVGWFSR